MLEVHVLLNILNLIFPHFRPFGSSALSEAHVNYSDPRTTFSFLAVGGKTQRRQGLLPASLAVGGHISRLQFLTVWRGQVWSDLVFIPKLPLFWLKQKDVVEAILCRNFGVNPSSPLQERLPKVEPFGWPPQLLSKWILWKFGEKSN